MNAPPLSVVADEVEGRGQVFSSETQPLLANDEARQNIRYGDEEEHSQLVRRSQCQNDNNDFFTKFKLVAAMLNFAISGIVLTGIGVCKGVLSPV